MKKLLLLLGLLWGGGAIGIWCWSDAQTGACRIARPGSSGAT